MTHPTDAPGSTPGGGGASAASQPQHDAVRLTSEQFGSLQSALGVYQPVGLDGLRDAEGRTIISQGTPRPGYEHLLGCFAAQRAVGTTVRTSPNGDSEGGSLWMSPHGIVWADYNQDDTVTLRRAPGSTVHPVLIDLLRLGPRPVPAREMTPVEIKPDLFFRCVHFQNGPEVPREARREMAEAVRHVTPGVAACLDRDEAALVVVDMDWDSVRGPRKEGLAYVDTPAGMLFHTRERGFLREKHLVDAGPAWLIWTRIASRLPTQEDIARWAETA